MLSSMGIRRDNMITRMSERDAKLLVDAVKRIDETVKQIDGKSRSCSCCNRTTKKRIRRKP